VRRELLVLASELARRAEPFAIVTVVSRKAPVSALAGDAALVTREGTLHGWIGGACTQPTVVAEVRRALADGRPRLVALDPDPTAPPRPGVSVFPMTCHSGGSVEILIQPVLPAPRLLVLGLSPTARALAVLAKAMGYAVFAVDPGAEAGAFPGADGVYTDPRDLPKGERSTSLFAVVATQGQWDEEAVRVALAHEPEYLGVVASAKRFAEMREALSSTASAEALARIKSPAGLDLGARLPEEIAVSILAEIVKQKRSAAPAAAPPAEPASATDPVCGMTVQITGAKHKAQHGGRDFFFCCGGCRERFVASPEKYLRPVER